MEVTAFPAPVKAQLEERPDTPTTCPSTPSLASAALSSRIALLREEVEMKPTPSLSLVWPEGCQHVAMTGLTDEAVWEDILIKFGASRCSAAHDAEHFQNVMNAGMDANKVPFPRLSPNGKIPASPSQGDDLTILCQDAIPFPLLRDIDPITSSCKDDAEQEAIEMLVKGRASSAEDLRKHIYTDAPFDMELESWPVLDDGIIASDGCTEAQLRVWKLREEKPLSPELIEKRRISLAKKLQGELNRFVFEERLPIFEREAACLEWKAALARDKAEEQRRFDEMAAMGSALVAWAVPHSRTWPEQPSVWKQHCKWFAMWRSKQIVGSSFAFKPLKRSSSESSLQSWAAVSEVSWVEIESKASDCGWQDVLGEQETALSAVLPDSVICKADITEVKAMSKPPNAVTLTMEVVCILLQVPPKKLADGGLDYWEPSKNLLGQPDFLTLVLSLRDGVPASVLDAVAPYMSREEFTPEVVAKSSLACKGLCAWAREVYKYHVLGQASANAAWRQFASQPEDELNAEAHKAIQSLSKGDLQELKALSKPPKGVDVVCSCLLHLFAGISSDVQLTAKGNVKDSSWKSCQKFMSNPTQLFDQLIGFSNLIDAGGVPRRNIEKVRRIKDNMFSSFSVGAVKAKSKAASGICSWILNTIAYYDAVAPNRHESTACDTASDKLPKSDTISGFSDLAKGDLVELKSVSKPPQLVMIVCVCVCVLRPLGTEDSNEGWAGAKRMLSDPRLLKSLSEYNKDQVTEEQVAKVREMLSNHACDADSIKRASKAAWGLLRWVLAILAHYDARKAAESKIQ